MYEKILKFCDEKNIPISTFERICGVSNGYVNKLKTTAPGVRFVKRAAQVMGISIEELTDEIV